jgi:hypothetical protein
MSLPDSYTLKLGAIPEYFETIQNAEPPDRFSHSFLRNLGFKSTNDRSLISILKEIGFLDENGAPTERYYKYLDESQSQKVLAQGIKEAYSELFQVNRQAFELSNGDIKNKLKTLYSGDKSNQVIGRIASTFIYLCKIADFKELEKSQKLKTKEESKQIKKKSKRKIESADGSNLTHKKVSLDSMQYHINIVLPESKDPEVYDAIFKSAS